MSGVAVYFAAMSPRAFSAPITASARPGASCCTLCGLNVCDVAAQTRRLVPSRRASSPPSRSETGHLRHRVPGVVRPPPARSSPTRSEAGPETRPDDRPRHHHRRHVGLRLDAEKPRHHHRIRAGFRDRLVEYGFRDYTFIGNELVSRHRLHAGGLQLRDHDVLEHAAPRRVARREPHHEHFLERAAREVRDPPTCSAASSTRSPRAAPRRPLPRQPSIAHACDSSWSTPGPVRLVKL